MSTLTLQKMRYLVAVASIGSVTGAAKELFVSQPSLTKTIREIEDEVGMRIFVRSPRGISVSRRGEEFLAYVRQVLEQADLLEEKYMQQEQHKRLFCISSQHYSFAVRAFADLIREHQDSTYDFSFRETSTYEIIEDVAEMRSALGILYINSFNESVLRHLFSEKDCVFTEIIAATPHVFLSREHPLAAKKSVTTAELAPYPYLFYDQGSHNSFYFAEEMFSTENHAQTIRVSDRATLFNLLVGVNGYTVCSGVHDAELTNPKIVAIPLRRKGKVHIGYITHRNRKLGALSMFYIDALRRYSRPMDRQPSGHS